MLSYIDNQASGSYGLATDAFKTSGDIWFPKLMLFTRVQPDYRPQAPKPLTLEDLGVRVLTFIIL